MVETIVNFAIEQLVQFANTEAELIGSISGEITFIRSELESINAVLKDAEIKAEDNEGIKVWVRQVREVAYKIEDAIDGYLFLQRERKDRPLVRVTHFFTQLRPKHKLANILKEIKEEVIQINLRRQRYELRTTEGTHHEHLLDHRRGHSSLYLDDTELVGVEVPRTEVTRLLEQSPLVAIVGMGGLGKTTLARKVYNQVKERFPVCAWVTVSQSYSVVDLLKDIYKQFLQATEKDFNWVKVDDQLKDIRSITEALRNYLTTTRNRYLVVLDDVWVEGSLINCIRDALPATNDGSRMLMTMRDEEIATFWTAKFKGDMYRLKPLPTKDALDLFCKQIFVNGECPAELRLLADDIIRKCDGLPLVLVAVGGLLSTKEMCYSEWSKLRDSLGSEFATNSHLKSSTRILLLSYQELPYYLKPCFLYCGIFPEDYSIKCKRLIRLWIAEGFIKSCRGKTLEEVAMEYLTSLIKRNLVHVSERDVTSVCPRTIRVHDVFREIILSKLEESGFSQVTTKNNPLENTHSRRLSIHNNFDESIQMCSTTCNIRSLIVFDNQHRVSSFLTKSQSKLFRFLRVLDLQDVRICDIPEELGDMSNLYLLSLRNTWVFKLPKSIGKLSNLQTLDLKGSNLQGIPWEVKYLHKLRHLIGVSKGFRHFKGNIMEFDLIKSMVIPMEVLKNFGELQTLSYIDGSQRSVIMELRSLHQLIKLGISEVDTENWADVFSAIEGMENLRSLSVQLTLHDNVYDDADSDDTIYPPGMFSVKHTLKPLTNPPRFLERFSLTGGLEKLPEWISMLTNLTKLKLRLSGLHEDPAEKLQGLANLVELELNNAYNGEKLDFGLDGFQKLKVLHLYGLSALKSITGALPALRRLYSHWNVEVPPHIQPYLEYTYFNDFEEEDSEEVDFEV